MKTPREETPRIQIFSGRRFVGALLLAIGLCGAAVALYYGVVFLVYGRAKALDSTADHAAWILRNTACLLFPWVVVVIGLKLRAPQKSKPKRPDEAPDPTARPTATDHASRVVHF